MELPESADSIGMKFKLIPAGTFIMGDASVLDNQTPHEVTLTKPFKMGVHEVTQDQYEQVMGVNPSLYKGADNPVERVSWEDAVEFCRRLSELPAEKAAGNVYRLPTEAEWEYACRAGTTTKFSFGDDESDLDDYAWFRENSAGKDTSSGRQATKCLGRLRHARQCWRVVSGLEGRLPEDGSVTDPTGACIRLVPRDPWRQLPTSPPSIVGRRLAAGTSRRAATTTARLSCFPESVWQVGGATSGERSPQA